MWICFLWLNHLHHLLSVGNVTVGDSDSAMKDIYTPKHTPTLARISLHAHTPLDTPLTTCKFQYSPIHLYIYIYPYLHTLLHTPILAYKLQISCQQYSACPYTFLYFPAAARAPHVVLSQSEGLWNIYFSLRFCLWNTLQAVALLKKNIIKKIAILANL